MDVEVTGAAELARKLGSNIDNAVQPALVAIGAVLQGIIAPYPPAPPRRGRTWYERGYGTRYANGRGRKTSQFLNRSWAVEPDPVTNGALVTNRATYTKWVHLAQTQTKVHQRTGWITDRQGVERATASGDIVRIVEQALGKVLPLEK